MTEPARDETVHIVEGYIEINHPVPARLAKALIARIRQQDETIKRMDEALEAIFQTAASARRHRGNIGKELFFLEVIENRARAARKEPTDG